MGLIELLFGSLVRDTLRETPFNFTGSLAPAVYPRADIAAILLQGVPTVNQQTTTSAVCSTVTSPPLADMLRLNLATDITPRDSQNPFGGLLGICPPAQAPVGNFGITDRAPLNA